MHELLTTLVELVGMACLTFGALLVAVWLGWVVAGICLLAVGYLASRTG